MGKNEFISNRGFKKHHFKPRTGIDPEELLDRLLRASESIQENTRRGTGDWVIHTGMDGLTMFNESFDLDLNTGQPAVYGPGSSPTYFDILPTSTTTPIEGPSLWSQLSANTTTMTL
jgi:hypothetical protein